jgi:virginiamycin B lyase
MSAQSLDQRASSGRSPLHRPLGGLGRLGSIIACVGAILKFAIPTFRSDPYITTGPDGNLWFKESKRFKIGRITTGGAITEFPIPTFQGFPWAITNGPDKTVWFTERMGKIGKIS